MVRKIQQTLKRFKTLCISATAIGRLWRFFMRQNTRIFSPKGGVTRAE